MVPWDPVHDLLVVPGEGGLLIFDRTAEGDAEPKAKIGGVRARAIEIYPPTGKIVANISGGGMSGEAGYVGVWSIHDNGDEVPPEWTLGKGVFRQIRGLTLGSRQQDGHCERQVLERRPDLCASGNVYRCRGSAHAGRPWISSLSFVEDVAGSEPQDSGIDSRSLCLVERAVVHVPASLGAGNGNEDVSLTGGGTSGYVFRCPPRPCRYSRPSRWRSCGASETRRRCGRRSRTGR